MSSIKSNYTENACFILGSGRVCFFIMKDRTINVVKISLTEMLEFIETSDMYISINRNIIINTQYFVEISNAKDRLILMQTGNILKVSRRNWDKFK